MTSKLTMNVTKRKISSGEATVWLDWIGDGVCHLDRVRLPFGKAVSMRYRFRGGRAVLRWTPRTGYRVAIVRDLAS